MGREEQQRRSGRGAAMLAMGEQAPQLTQLDEIIHRTLLGSGQQRPSGRTKRSRGAAKAALDLEGIARLSKRVLVPPVARRAAKSRTKMRKHGVASAKANALAVLNRAPPTSGRAPHASTRLQVDAATKPSEGTQRPSRLHAVRRACGKLRAGEAFAFAFCIMLVTLLALNIVVALVSSSHGGTSTLNRVESKIDRHFDDVHSHLDAALGVHAAGLERRATRGAKQGKKAQRKAHRAAKRMESRVGALERSAHAVVKLHNGTLRTDFRCGARFDDSPCNASSENPCCSRHGWCGPLATHCDELERNGAKSHARKTLRGGGAASAADILDRSNANVLASPPSPRGWAEWVSSFPAVAPRRQAAPQAKKPQPPGGNSSEVEPLSLRGKAPRRGPRDEAILEEFFSSVNGGETAETETETAPSTSSAFGPFAPPAAAPAPPLQGSSPVPGALLLCTVTFHANPANTLTRSP